MNLHYEQRMIWKKIYFQKNRNWSIISNFEISKNEKVCFENQNFSFFKFHQFSTFWRTRPSNKNGFPDIFLKFITCSSFFHIFENLWFRKKTLLVGNLFFREVSCCLRWWIILVLGVMVTTAKSEYHGNDRFSGSPKMKPTIYWSKMKQNNFTELLG